jgi:hypothetical protein
MARRRACLLPSAAALAAAAVLLLLCAAPPAAALDEAQCFAKFEGLGQSGILGLLPSCNGNAASVDFNACCGNIKSVVGSGGAFERCLCYRRA